MDMDRPPGGPADAEPFSATLIWDAPGSARVVLRGELDLAAHRQLCDVLEQAIVGGDGDLRVDAAALSFCDAGALGLLLAADQRLRAENHRLTLDPVNDRVRRITTLAEAEALLPDSAR